MHINRLHLIYTLTLLFFTGVSGAINSAPRITRIQPDIPNNIVWVQADNITVGTIITVYFTTDQAKIGISNLSTFNYSFYGYDEIVNIAVSMSEIGYFWITQTPFYPVPL